jgi:hypothetical protein
MTTADLDQMLSEISSIPELIEQLSTLGPAQSISADRVLVVGYGANLDAARVLERTLAERGVGMRVATPDQAVPLPGEAIICITRSAASDQVMHTLIEHAGRAERACILLTANPTAPVIGELPEHVHVAPLGLAVSRPVVATQSVLAIVMTLDCMLSTDPAERHALWLDFARSLRADLPQLVERSRGRSEVVALAERVFLAGDDTMGAVAQSITRTLMEVSPTLAVPIPLGSGTRGPALHLGEGDLALLIGNGPAHLFASYRQGTGYSLHIQPPANQPPLTQALYTLVEGQLLAAALGRLR